MLAYAFFGKKATGCQANLLLSGRGRRCPHADCIRAILHEEQPDQGDRIMSTAAEQWKADGFNQGLMQLEAKGEWHKSYT